MPVIVRFDPSILSPQSQVIPDASERSPGVATPAMVQKINSVPPGGGVSSVGGTAPITSTGGLTPSIGITPATALVPGSMSAADKAKLNALPAAASFFGRTVNAASTTIGTFTVPPNTAGLLHVTVGCVSGFFSVGAFFEAECLVARNGSGDGSIDAYSLLRSVISIDLSAPPAPSIAPAPGAMPGGLLRIVVTGKFGFTIDWTVTITPCLATQGQ